MSALYRTVEGDVVDLVVHRVFGTTAGLTEEMLALNPGLADRGPILEAGLELRLPVPPAETPAAPVRLWS